MTAAVAGRRGAVGILVGVAVLVMVVAALVGPGDGRRGGPPLDPRSTIDSGTRAAALLLEATGHEVSVGGISTRAGVHVLFDDRLRDDERATLLELVDAGSTVVVADPGSPLVDRVVASGTVASSPQCAVPSLADVRSLSVGLVAGLAAGDASCYPVDDGWFVSIHDRGLGRIVGVGSARPFTNARLDDEHHAALLVGLVDVGDGSVRIVHAAPGSGERSLLDLVSQPVRAALALGLVAVMAYGAHRARRLGAPVTERDPVEIEGSELVAATARLHQRARAREHVLAAARARLVRDLGERWLLGDVAAVDAELDRRRVAASDAEHIRSALDETPSRDDADFVARLGHLVAAQRVVRGAT